MYKSLSPSTSCPNPPQGRFPVSVQRPQVATKGGTQPPESHTGNKVQYTSTVRAGGIPAQRPRKISPLPRGWGKPHAPRRIGTAARYPDAAYRLVPAGFYGFSCDCKPEERRLFLLRWRIAEICFGTRRHRRRNRRAQPWQAQGFY